ncbi:RNA-directed DNA polymerase, eukaryota [Tanacetum coccineum]
MDAYEAHFAKNTQEPLNEPSGDPFGLDDLILKSSKKGTKVAQETNDSQPRFPPGFTPQTLEHPENENIKVNHESVPSPVSKQSMNDQNRYQDLEETVNKSTRDSKHEHVDSMARPNKPINRFSVLERLQEFIHIGQAMDYDMKGALWAYMTGIINRWHGEIIVMGDFNEVRYDSERHGSSFHSLNAADFNIFITNSQLIDIPLGGYSFTWSDKHASKMRKLDRPILLKESHADYGPTPFCLFHSWFLEEDFYSVIEDSWNNDEWSSAKRSSKDHVRNALQDSLVEIDQHLDKCESLLDDLSKRAEFFHDLKAIDQKDSIDLVQKEKVKWAVKGDENSKFFHGIVNKNRKHLAIKGILVDGEWIDNPTRVKSEFYSYFANRFSPPDWMRAPLEGNFPRHLDYGQSCDLEGEVTNEEIKRAIWDYGSNKSLGSDGFTFEFFKKFWAIVGGDVINAVKEFFSSSSFPKGCNSSFISLIPKFLDVKHLNKLPPISLIGCQYKIIGKILANRLSVVIDEIISQEQSAFIRGRQIMDGPLILNELIS